MFGALSAARAAETERKLDGPLVSGGQSEGRAQRNVWGFVVRKATAADYSELADLANLAGGDTLSFIAKGIDPTSDARLIYRDMIASPTGLFSYQNCFVAELDGRIVGLANGFPAKAIENDRMGIKLTAREEHLEARTRLNDPHSYLLNNIAVDPAHHRRGVGTRLLEAVVEEARQQYFSSITLHVWADNADAIAFYQERGFRIDGSAMIQWHPELPHVGGSLVFRLNLR